MKFIKGLFNKNINKKIKIPFPLIDIYYFQWDKNIPTGIHDHAEKGCLLLLFKGKLYENIYDTNDLKLIKKNIYKAPNISYINNNIGYHSILPIQKSKSIHIYYPKNYKTNYYNNKNTMVKI